MLLTLEATGRPAGDRGAPNRIGAPMPEGGNPYHVVILPGKMTTWLPNSRYHHCQEVSFFTVLRLGVGKSMGETLEANPGYLRQFLRNWSNGSSSGLPTMQELSA